MALLAVACALLVPALSAAQSPSPTSSLLVKLVDGLSAQEQADVIARDGGIERSVIPVLRLHVIEVPPSDLDADDLGIYLVVRPDRGEVARRHLDDVQTGDLGRGRGDYQVVPQVDTAEGNST